MLMCLGGRTLKVLCMVNYASRLMSLASVGSSRRLLLPAGPVGVSIIVSLLGTPKDGT